MPSTQPIESTGQKLTLAEREAAALNYIRATLTTMSDLLMTLGKNKAAADILKGRDEI